MRIDLFIDKSVEENAQVYYELAKKSKKKLEGAKKALSDTLLKVESESKKREANETKNKLILSEKNRKREWFEKFRWFFSSDNFLVIGGRDASSNEVVVKKHMDSFDVVFHTEAPGSPFVIIKNPDKKNIPLTTKEEAACFAATFSKAWDLGIKRVEVFEVLPEQVSKQAKSGEYISKGAFMVQGKRTLHNCILNLAIGYFLDLEGNKVVMSGPESAVRKKCDQFIVLNQGDLKKSDISKMIVKKFGLGSNEAILSCLPSGKFGVKKH